MWRTANFDRTAVGGEVPEAMACYDQAGLFLTKAPEVRDEPIEAASVLAEALTRRILSAAGLDTWTAVLDTIEPHAGDLGAHLATLNQTMQLAEAAYAHIANLNGGAGNSWQALLRVALLMMFGWGAPPASVLRVESGVSDVELTAPFAGYGIFTSASTDPSDNQNGAGSASSACVRGGFPNYMPALRSTRARGTSLWARLLFSIKGMRGPVASTPGHGLSSS